MSNTTNIEVANTILAQLGGNRFLAMTGSKNLVAIENGLTLKLGRGASNGITHLTVVLRADDTYDVRFQRVHGVKVTEKGGTEGAYADMLRDVFTSATGFATSL
tara:strand:- start:1877 stop:2188 length:312 start_codon:yes stop_codon:yes gene_type:complete